MGLAWKRLVAVGLCTWTMAAPLGCGSLRGGSRSDGAEVSKDPEGSPGSSRRSRRQPDQQQMPPEPDQGDSQIIRNGDEGAGASISRFGLHAPGTGGAVKSIGALAVRRIIHWDHLEPQPDEYRWDDAGKYVNMYERVGAELVLSLRCDNTRWGVETKQERGDGTSYSIKSALPKNMSDWVDYVGDVVEKMDGDGRDDLPGLMKPVKYWQIENEFVYQWAGTPEELVELMRTTYETIKKADPDAHVISPAFYNTNAFAMRDGQLTRGWFYQGSDDSRRQKMTRDRVMCNDKPYVLATTVIRDGHKYFDIVDLHIFAMDLVEVQADIAWVKDQLRAAGTSKPIWCLEFAAPYHEFSDERFNQYTIQAPTVAFASGVERIFWNSGVPVTPHENFRRLSLQTESGKPKRAMYNYALAVQTLNGWASVVKESAPSGVMLFRYNYPNSTKKVWVAWSEDGSAREVNIPTQRSAEIITMVPEKGKEPASRKKTPPSADGVTVTVKSDPVLVLAR